MALDPIEPSAFDFILKVERLYAGLTATAGADANSEQGLGGELLYAGKLDGSGRALLVAGNIAGVATLAATADGAAQKQAVKDGVADFLVTTLDEALRILKNQIRKREAAAVCVAATPEAIEHEMLERGVLPDLLRPADDGELETPSPFTKQGACAIVFSPPGKNSTLLIWQVAEAPALWLPKLDVIALGCLDTEHEDWAARRWLRLAPRYLGRLAKGTRALRTEAESAKKFAARVRDAVESGEVGVEVRMSFGDLSWLAEPTSGS